MAVPAAVIEVRQHFVQRHFGATVRAATDLLIGGVGDDAVEPGPEGRLASERVDLADHRPDGVLNDFLGVLLAQRDPGRQTIRTVTVRRDQMLHGGWLTAAE